MLLLCTTGLVGNAVQAQAAGELTPPTPDSASGDPDNPEVAANESVPPKGAPDSTPGGQLPPPGQARSVARPDQDSTPLVVPDGLLLLPRTAWRVATAPVLWLAELQDEHHVYQRAEELFFNDERTFAVLPTAFYETGLRPSVGARLVHKDLFGERESLLLRAGFGKWLDQIYEGRIDTGRRLRDGRLSLQLRYEMHDRGRFYGIGNAALVEASTLQDPIDATAADRAVEARHGEESAAATLGVAAPLGRRFQVYARHRFRARDLWIDPELGGDDPWITEVYRADSVVGFGERLIDAYTEVALALDTRRVDRMGLPRKLPSSGLRLDMWAGSQVQIERPRSVFGRVGFDLQPYINLYRGDRVLRLRLRGAAALGSLDEIPSVDLPALGGGLILRGYRTRRFRGRYTLLATAEYRYPLHERFAAYLFVDGGRAFVGWQDLALEDVRVGFGGGIVTYGHKMLSLRIQVASSIDGGLALHLALNMTDEPNTSY